MSKLTNLERVHAHSRVEANGCWTWTGKVNGRGYGYVVGGNGSVAAHRFSFEAHGRNIPAGLVLDHLCNNKLCVNPDHLNPTTDRENIMRADGVCAKNARKTHCKWGHEFTPENTYRTPSGTRECRTCKLAIKRKWRRAHAKKEYVHQRRLARVRERAEVGRLAAEAMAEVEPNPIVRARYEGQAQAFAMVLKDLPARTQGDGE